MFGTTIRDNLLVSQATARMISCLTPRAGSDCTADSPSLPDGLDTAQTKGVRLTAGGAPPSGTPEFGEDDPGIANSICNHGY